MRMKRITLLIFALLVALPGKFVFGAPTGTEQSRIPTVTRLVQMFSTLENELNENLRTSNLAAIQKLVTDDFELRAGSMPASPTPLAEWIRRSVGKDKPQLSIQQMAVHDYGNIAVVSFLFAHRTGNKDKSGDNIFIVDIWKKSGESWKLASRYASPSGSPSFSIPGAATDLPRIEKRY